ncbi:MAG: flagellar export protein FliJ [Mesoaciditoga sp.]|nr:MAG: flagellar export protein FliJ [Mesoaciditoga sp.]PMP80274.1 MAG: flagellar export protein FliJ [Mesoaciditoga sp.]HEU23616.1 flagellar export protein FliJ [Mesoaciditoga lauensis]
MGRCGRITNSKRSGRLCSWHRRGIFNIREDNSCCQFQSHFKDIRGYKIVKAFYFSLQKLLDLKISQIEILKIEILKTSNTINDLKKEILSLDNEIKFSQDSMEKGMNTINDLKQWVNYIQSLYVKRKNLTLEVAKIEDKLAELKKEYVKIYMEKKSFENLKKIKKSEHDLEELKEMQNSIDEFAQRKK